MKKDVEKSPKNIDPELGHIGIEFDEDYVYERAKIDLKFPYSISTYDKMCQDIVIATAMSLVNVTGARTPLYFEAFDDKKSNLKKRDFLSSCFEDMTHSMKDFILSCLTSSKYGFSVVEKVFRFRNKSEGSKFDDGLVGFKRLPLRHQSTITGWDFDDKQRDLLGVYQKSQGSYFKGLNRIDGFKVTTLKRDISNQTFEDIYLPRNRFLHIKVDGAGGNPEGKSPLSPCYTTWRKIQVLLDTEEIACYKNLNGIPVLKIPAIYMSEDATPEQKKVAQIHKDGVTKLGRGDQAGLLLPSDRDENGSPYFDFKLESASASNITAISSVIEKRYEQIYQCLFSDLVVVSSGTSGAVKSKVDLLNSLVESRLNEICEQINEDLIPDLFRRNGWDDTETPKIKVGQIADIDMSVFAKAMQQLKATNLVPVTPENINFISSVFNLPYRVKEDATDEEVDELLRVDSQIQSRSGDGLAKGSGNGTSDDVSVDDNSASNLGNS